MHCSKIMKEWFHDVLIAAGDHVKFGFPMASATTALVWGFIEWRDSYISAGLEEDMLACIKWPLDYFMKAHPSKYEFYAQVMPLFSE